MNKRRLLTLARFLETKVPADKFNMGHWMMVQNGETLSCQKAGDCGTAACAIGWAATIPAFAEAGLKIRPAWRFSSYGVVAFAGEIEFEAVAAFFDISEPEAEHLFYAPNYRVKTIKPQHVAARIRETVEAAS